MHHNMADDLEFIAGNGAFEMIKGEGLKPGRVRVIPGAAGGPKWLVLNAMDRLIFGRWLAGGPNPVHLIGASIGAWRFAAAAQSDPEWAIGRFEHAYIHQHYDSKPSPEAVSAESVRVLDHYLDETGVRDILSHSGFRLNIIAVRCRNRLTSSRRRVPQGLGLALAAAANGVSRKLLGWFFERTVFHSPEQGPPLFPKNTFSLRQTPLSEANFRKALLASGSIPLVMSGVENIPGAAPGVFRDGGVLDYHMDLPFAVGQEELVLFPHYMPRVIPGWMDKRLKWRKPRPDHMDRVLLVAPSEGFVRRLPLGKIPDRNDFYRFKGRDGDRIAYWQAVVEKGRLLADAFHEAVESGTIRESVRRLNHSRD